MPKYNALKTKELMKELFLGEIDLQESFEIVSFLRENKGLCVPNASCAKEDFESFLKNQEVLILKQAVEERDEKIATALLKKRVNLDEKEGKKSVGEYLKKRRKSIL